MHRVGTRLESRKKPNLKLQFTVRNVRIMASWMEWPKIVIKVRWSQSLRRYVDVKRPKALLVLVPDDEVQKRAILALVFNDFDNALGQNEP